MRASGLTKVEVQYCIEGCNNISNKNVYIFLESVRKIRAVLGSNAPPVAAVVHALIKSNGDVDNVILTLKVPKSSSGTSPSHPQRTTGAELAPSGASASGSPQSAPASLQPANSSFRWSTQVATIQEVLSKNAPEVDIIVDALDQSGGNVNEAVWALSESHSASSAGSPHPSAVEQPVPTTWPSPLSGVSSGDSGSRQQATDAALASSGASASSPHTQAPPSPPLSNTRDDVKTLWSSLLDFAKLDPVIRSLGWGRKKDEMYLSRSITDANDPCYQFVVQQTRDNFVDVHRIDRIVMVGLPADTIDTFDSTHKREGMKIARNKILQTQMTSDPACKSALDRLKQSCIPCIPDDEFKSLIVLGWHGTPIQHVEELCRDGPRSLRTTDSGYFGTGSYFALEALYASKYAGESGEMALVLFAISVTQVKPITVENDYRDVEDPAKPGCHGFSKFCSGDAQLSIALARLCDAHFIPVKYYGKVHPRTGKPTLHDVHYQAVDEHSGLAEAHELVIHDHKRCVPLAIVYFNKHLHHSQH
ncbi:Hypothetical protein, putative [Bodo saltans]|uniref:Poly [ADP-ribose] polymerase n=1 Tax=Bodo saltans TaxID=75058 RepID=A0A0S4JAR3_BODSA|nr:Hypothetical protein, putative [Bodo saltans]|eukprot:CUG87284.1 Hypothetical protein, putative [Bodo saltans]